MDQDESNEKRRKTQQNRKRMVVHPHRIAVRKDTPALFLFYRTSASNTLRKATLPVRTTSATSLDGLIASLRLKHACLRGVSVRQLYVLVSEIVKQRRPELIQPADVKMIVDGTRDLNKCEYVPFCFGGCEVIFSDTFL